MPRKQSVFFLIDTQGANCVGAYRPSLALGTPHLDRLATQGVRFDRAYSCSPVCGPARSAIFTGLYPHSNGVLGNDQAPHLDLPTVGQRLQGAGIKTGYIGKWHLDGGDYFGNGICPPGWDPTYWFDGRNYLASLPDEAARQLSRRALAPDDVARHGVTSEFTHAHRTADHAIDFIRRHRDEDFLLVVSIDEPHHPWICPEPFVSAFEDFLFPVPNAHDSLADKPNSQREWAAHTAPHWTPRLVERDGTMHLRHPRHFACNSYSDSQVGRVLAALDATTPDALVVYTADHGDMFGSHRLHGKGPCVYDEIARIPLIVRWPGVAPAGSVARTPASHIDLVPTLLDFFGLPTPDILQGRSMLAQFRAPETARENLAFIEFNRFEIDHDGFGAFAPIRAVCDGRYKLALSLLDTDELYDLTTDPGEMQNLIAAPGHAATRDRLHAALIAWMNRTRDPLRGPHWSRRAWSDPAGRGSTWGGPTRPRPADPGWFTPCLLYDTAERVTRAEYPKS